MENPHFGKMIQEEIKAQERTVTWFAQAIHCDRTNAYKIFNSSRIDTQLLMRISLVLNHDFFLDGSKFYEQTIATDPNEPT